METDKIYKLAEKHNVKIINVEIDGKIEAFSLSVNDEKFICIDRRKIKDNADEKYKLAHELGHHISDAYYEYENDTIYKYKAEYEIERKADEYAISLLIPLSELNVVCKMGYNERQIAEHFDVPQELVTKAFWVYFNEQIS